MNAPAVSFCTYTYNDAELVTGLLRTVGEWSLRPDEIVVTDDGSDIPYSIPEDLSRALPPLKLIRLPENRGFTIAKHTGISASSGGVVFSADSDARVDPDYLRRCREHLKRPEVGLVGGCSLVDAGGGPLGRYLQLFGDNYSVRETGPVDFIPGVAFCLRREAWDEVGGFSSHRRRNCADHILCSLLKKRGYLLLMDADIRVTQVRRLSRHAQCRRCWLWCGPPLLETIMDEFSLPKQLVGMYVVPMLRRITYCLQKGELILIYYDLLCVVYAAFEFCRELAARDRLSPNAASGLWAFLQASLHGFPRMLALIKADLLRLGALPVPDPLPAREEAGLSPLAQAPDWSEAFAFLDDLAGNGALTWLEGRGVAELLEEERRQTDFSSYFQKGVAASACNAPVPKPL